MTLTVESWIEALESGKEGTFSLGSLPQAIRDQLKRFGYLGDAFASLVGMNDRGVPFPLIAKVISARPKGLFRTDAEDAP